MKIDLVNIAKFCAEEIIRQRDSVTTLAPYIQAWVKAISWFEGGIPLTPAVIIELHHIAKPDLRGYRNYDVYVGSKRMPDPQTIKRSMLMLFGSGLTPAEFYKEFEEIHPFQDGNGRIGKIIFNWHNNTLGDPLLPPNFWGHENL